jgi:hypothetical protein
MATPKDWDPETKANIAWLKRVKPPNAQFMLAEWAEVVNPEKFFVMLRMDVEACPDGTRALTGAIQADLALLRDLWRKRHAGQ